jgi:hypothetical protein
LPGAVGQRRSKWCTVAARLNNALSGDLAVMSNDTVPSVEALLRISLSAEQIKGYQRTLLNLDLPAADRKRQYDQVVKSRKDRQRFWETYEALEKAPGEEKLWQELVTAWGRWVSHNDEFFRISREYDALVDREMKDAQSNATYIGLVQKAGIPCRRRWVRWTSFARVRPKSARLSR